jgi:hypothetical protein
MARHGFFCSSSRTGKRIYMMQTATHTLHTLQIAVLRLSFGILMYALTCPPIHSYGPAIPASDHKERMGKEYDNADNACMRACPYTCQVCIFHATGRVCVCVCARARTKRRICPWCTLFSEWEEILEIGSMWTYFLKLEEFFFTFSYNKKKLRKKVYIGYIWEIAHLWPLW